MFLIGYFGMRFLFLLGFGEGKEKKVFVLRYLLSLYTDRLFF